MKRFEASFKKKGQQLWWLECEAETEIGATAKLKEYAKGTGFRLYGGPFEKKTTKQNVQL